MLYQLSGASALPCCCLVPAAPGLLVAALVVSLALLLSGPLARRLMLRWLDRHLAVMACSCHDLMSGIGYVGHA